jgi:micrococcal nuclease
MNHQWKRIFPLFFCAVIFGALLTGCNPNKAGTDQMAATVVYVIDGDTIKVKVNHRLETVRMLLIDTPETDHPSKGEQPYGRQAKRMTQKLLPPGQQVTLVFGGEKRDKYGRLLAHVFADGKNVEEALLAEGLARVAYVYEADARESDDRKAEEEAEKKHLNIWAVPGYVQEDGFHPEVIARIAKYVASKNSEVYHPVGCPDAKQILWANRIYFQSEKEAIASGRHRSHSNCWDSLGK